MKYLILGLIILRVFLCERVMPAAGILFDLMLCGLFGVYFLTDKNIKLNRKIIILLFCFLGAIFVSLPFSVNVYTSQNEFLRLLLCGLTFVFVYLQSGRKKNWLLLSIVGFSLLISLRAVYQYFLGLAYINDNYTLQQITLEGFYALEMLKQKRVVSFFFAPNILAGYLVMIIPIAAGYAVKSNYRRKMKKMLLFLMIILFASWALMLTQSFGALVGLGLAVLLSGIIGLKVKGQTFTFKRIISFSLVIILCLIIVYAKRAESFSDPRNPDNSIIQRVYYWQAAKKIFLQNPLWGVGLGNYSILYTKLKDPNANETIYAHNIILQFLAEGGFPSALFFLIFVLNVYLRFGRRYRDPVEIGVLISSVAFLLYNLTDYNFFVMQSGYLWWVITACIVNPHHNESDRRKKKDIFSAWIVRCSAGMICMSAVFYLQSEYRSQRFLDQALLLFNKEEFVPAIEKAERSASLRKNNDTVYYFLASAYQQMSKDRFSQVAVDYYQKAIRLNPQYCYYYYYLGRYYLDHAMLKEAVLNLQKAVELYPGNKEFNYFYRKSVDLNKNS